jgi:hypothetical protein
VCWAPGGDGGGASQSLHRPGGFLEICGPVWFGGGKLAADLTLPKLRSRWNVSGPAAGDRFTAAERNVIWEHAARTAAGAGEQIRNLAATDPAAAADAAWAAADMLHAAAAALGSWVLRQAADSYDRAARAPYGRIPRPARPGNGLRRAARLLSTADRITGDDTLAQTTLLARFARLVEAVVDLREAQRNAFRQQPRAVQPSIWTPAPRRPARARTAEHSNLEFPFPPSTVRPENDPLTSAHKRNQSAPIRHTDPGRPRGAAILGSPPRKRADPSMPSDDGCHPSRNFSLLPAWRQLR